jgi:hypothetical protein
LYQVQPGQKDLPNRGIACQHELCYVAKNVSENTVMRKINIRASSSKAYCCIAMTVAAAVLFCYSSALATERLSQDRKALIAKYHSIKPKLEKNQFGIPLYLDSAEDVNFSHVDIYGIFEYPFESVRDAFGVPANWCDIAILHMNIKAGTFAETGDQWQVTLYDGLKSYQPPQDAFAIHCRFRVLSQRTDYLHVSLFAAEGPIFTKDHSIGVEAVPIDKRTAFVHFSYSCRYEPMGRMAIKTYFATVGRNKKGFTIMDTDKEGNPSYIGGVRGALERTAVRYYLALQTYMDTLNVPAEQRFEKRINEWYDLTAHYPVQLYEMDKEDYLANKRREYANQLILQGKAAR